MRRKRKRKEKAGKTRTNKAEKRAGASEENGNAGAKISTKNLKKITQ